MNPQRFNHHVTSVRYQGTGPPTITNIALEADVQDESILARLVDPGPVNTSRLMSVAATMHETLLRKVPEPHRSEFVVEAGHVKQHVFVGIAEPVTIERTYRLTACRGEVFALLEKSFAKKIPVPWVGLAPTVKEDLPVILGASAVLALIEQVLEFVSTNSAHTGSTISNHLSVFESAVSPYAPHSSPLAALGEEWASQRTLIAQGVLREFAGRGPDSQLFLHPERWSHPFAALSTDSLSNLFVTCDRKAAFPRRALFVEALTPLASGFGLILWEGLFSVMTGKNKRLVDDAPTKVRLDARQVLSQISGAVEAPRPALASDPIAGDRYGVAPSLLTGLSTDEIYG
jgi:hypothetical protein